MRNSSLASSDNPAKEGTINASAEEGQGLDCPRVTPGQSSTLDKNLVGRRSELCAGQDQDTQQYNS